MLFTSDVDAVVSTQHPSLDVMSIDAPPLIKSAPFGNIVMLFEAAFEEPSEM